MDSTSQDQNWQCEYCKAFTTVSQKEAHFSCCYGVALRYSQLKQSEQQNQQQFYNMNSSEQLIESQYPTFDKECQVQQFSQNSNIFGQNKQIQNQNKVQFWQGSTQQNKEILQQQQQISNQNKQFQFMKPNLNQQSNIFEQPQQQQITKQDFDNNPSNQIPLIFQTEDKSQSKIQHNQQNQSNIFATEDLSSRIHQQQQNNFFKQIFPKPKPQDSQIFNQSNNNQQNPPPQSQVLQTQQFNNNNGNINKNNNNNNFQFQNLPHPSSFIQNQNQFKQEQQKPPIQQQPPLLNQFKNQNQDFKTSQNFQNFQFNQFQTNQFQNQSTQQNNQGPPKQQPQPFNSQQQQPFQQQNIQQSQNTQQSQIFSQFQNQHHNNQQQQNFQQNMFQQQQKPFQQNQQQQKFPFPFNNNQQPSSNFRPNQTNTFQNNNFNNNNFQNNSFNNNNIQNNSFNNNNIQSNSFNNNNIQSNSFKNNNFQNNCYNNNFQSQLPPFQQFCQQRIQPNPNINPFQPQQSQLQSQPRINDIFSTYISRRRFYSNSSDESDEEDYQELKNFDLYKKYTDEDVNQMSDEQIYQYFVHQYLNENHGYSQDQISSGFSQLHHSIETNNENLCVICQDIMTEEQKYICIELTCRHIFHEECLKKWLQKKKECPICKFEVEF